MKILLKLSIYLLMAILLFFPKRTLLAQDCTNYYYMTNNAEVEMTMYDAKGKKAGVQTWKISDVKNDGEGFKSTINSSLADDKGKEFAKGTGLYRCNGGKLLADIRMSIPQDNGQAINAADARLTDAFIEYPSVLTEGMLLPDAFFSMEMNTSGIPSTTQFQMKNRKVVSKETITTAAGSWEAYKITYDAEMKIKMGGLGIPVIMKTTEWFVPNFGTVKSETYSRKGQLRGSTLLTKLKR